MKRWSSNVILCLASFLWLCCQGETTNENGPSDNPQGLSASFIAFGDWGDGSTHQRDVASSIKRYCAHEMCEFVLTLGDNFYNNGVQSVDDPQWQEKYRSIYKSLDLPFYVVLGNHDSYGSGSNQAQIDYSNFDSSWHLPAENYTFCWPQDFTPCLIEFFIFNSVNFSQTTAEWLNGALASSNANWKILATHHHLYGVAVDVRNLGDNPLGYNHILLPVICNQVDLALVGHTHAFSHLQTDEDGCLIDQVMIGTGGQYQLEPVNDDDPRLLASGDDFWGFGWFQATETLMSFRMIRSDRTVYYETSWKKQAIGRNDFRISDMGPDGDTRFAGFEPAVVYNSKSDEYLVLWSGDDNTGELVDGEFEIFGQRINAVTGEEVGANDFRISDMGPNGESILGAFNPVTAYNITNNEYLVVWSGDDVNDDEFKIYGQRVNATTGEEIGTNDFRISDLGTDGDSRSDHVRPSVAYNEVNNEYLVVWGGDTAIDDELEIFGQRLDAATGEKIGENFRISDMGTDGDPNFDAQEPAVAYNGTDNEYLVVWRGDDSNDGLSDDEFEIFSQTLNASTGEKIGENFRISDMGPDGDPNFDAQEPAVAYNGTDNEFLVVWEGDDNSDTLVDEKFETFGQKLNASTGGKIGNNFRISEMGPDGDPSLDAILAPTIAYNSIDNKYLVVWRGDNNIGGLVDDEFEIFVQEIDAATGEETGTNDLRISDMGPDRDISFGAFLPSVAFNTSKNQYLVVWEGDDNRGSLLEGEVEVFGQRLASPE